MTPGDEPENARTASSAAAASAPASTARRSWPQRLRRRFAKAELITEVQRSPAQNYRHRKTVYAIMQGARIPCLLLSALTYFLWGNPVVSGALFIISTLLPWVSVVIANGAGEPVDKRHPRQYKPARVREQRAMTHPELSASSQHALPEGTGDYIIIDASEEEGKIP